MSSSSWIRVVHEAKQYEMPSTQESRVASEVLEWACTQVHVKPARFMLKRNGVILKGDELVSPYSTVHLVPMDDSGHTFTKKLWHIASSRAHSDIVKAAARDVMEEISRALHKRASYGIFEYDGTQEIARLREVLPDCAHDVLRELRVQFHSVGIYPDREWRFSWRMNPEDMVITKLSGRDLVCMGYNPAEENLFQTIMYRLRGAIIDGEVSGDYLEAQIKWVRSSFPLPPGTPRRR